MKKEVYFISGIDTNVGKTYATGMLARKFAAEGQKVITQKMVQTGCKGISEDILMHRKIQNIPLTPEDEAGLTCPYVFSYPASPHLASRLDNETIEPMKIREATNSLLETYDTVLLEGAGGLMVPITQDYLIIDYIEENKLPVIIVSSGKLGSINHTLLSLEICETRGIKVAGLVYNEYPTFDTIIQSDSKLFLKNYLLSRHPMAKWFYLPLMSNKLA